MEEYMKLHAEAALAAARTIENISKVQLNSEALRLALADKRALMEELLAFMLRFEITAEEESYLCCPSCGEKLEWESEAYLKDKEAGSLRPDVEENPLAPEEFRQTLVDAYFHFAHDPDCKDTARRNELVAQIAELKKELDI